MEGPDPIRNADHGRGWHLRPMRLRVLQVLGAALGVTFAVVSPMLWSADDAAMSAVLTAMGLGFLLLILPQRRRRQDMRTVIDGAGRGTLIPVHTPTRFRIVANAVVGCLLVVLGPLAAVEQRAWQALGACGLGALLVYVAQAALRVRRLPHRGVLLLPDAIVLHTRPDSTVIAWSDVRKVRAHWRRQLRGFRSPDEPIVNWLTFELRGVPLGELGEDGRPRSPSVAPTTFAVDPELALSVIRYYLEHPAHRDELGTERALERVRAAQISAQVS